MMMMMMMKYGVFICLKWLWRFIFTLPFNHRRTWHWRPEFTSFIVWKSQQIQFEKVNLLENHSSILDRLPWMLSTKSPNHRLFSTEAWVLTDCSLFTKKQEIKRNNKGNLRKDVERIKVLHSWHDYWVRGWSTAIKNSNFKLITSIKIIPKNYAAQNEWLHHKMVAFVLFKTLWKANSTPYFLRELDTCTFSCYIETI